MADRRRCARRTARRRWRSSCRLPAASRSSRTVRRLPLVARRPTRTRAETRAHFGIDPAGAVGAAVIRRLRSSPDSICPPLDCLRELDGRDDRSHRGAGRALPDGVRLDSRGRDSSSSGFRYEDLVAAVDVVVDQARLRHHRRVHLDGHGHALHVARHVSGVRRCSYARTAAIRAEPFHRTSGRFARGHDGGGALDAPAAAAGAGLDDLATDGADAARRGLTDALDASRSG